MLIYWLATFVTILAWSCLITQVLIPLLGRQQIFPILRHKQAKGRIDLTLDDFAELQITDEDRLKIKQLQRKLANKRRQ